MIPIVVRGRAAEACIERFSGKMMRWGKVDCGQIAKHNLHNLGLSVGPFKLLNYRTEQGALDDLKSLGFAGLGEAVSSIEALFPIPPAMATTADLIGFKTESEAWDMALAVCVGNGKSLGIVDGYARVFTHDLSQSVAAWRCNPCLK